MAKFCSNCGKKLEEGNPCSCQKETSIMENEFVVKGIDIIKNIFIKPIDTIKSYTKEDSFTFSMILVGIMSFLSALFMMPLIKAFYGTQTVSLYSSFVQTIEIPYFKVFLGTLIITFALSFVFVGVLYLTNTILFKGKANFKTIYSLYGVCSLVSSAALAFGTILAFIKIQVGLIVLVLGLVLNMVYTIYGIKFIGPKDENKYGYIYLVTIVLNVIVMTFLLQIFA